MTFWRDIIFLGFLSTCCCFELSPLPVGVEIRGINLTVAKSEQEHSLVVFKDQGVVPGKRQREITEWFGELTDQSEPHPETEHPGVFRISNDPAHGYLGAGNETWHIDGSFLEKPHSHSLYHIIKCPSRGSTAFASLTRMLDEAPAHLKAEWDELYLGTNVRKTVGMKVDEKDGSACPAQPPAHPLLYHHPVTGKQVLCFNVDLIKSFGKHLGTQDEQWTDEDETKRIKKDIVLQIEKDNGKFVHTHQWSKGDLIITDNLAVAHSASAETQLPPIEVGLRILHRTTVKGRHEPSKRRDAGHKQEL